MCWDSVNRGMRRIFFFICCCCYFAAPAQLFTGGCNSYIDQPVSLRITSPSTSITYSDSSRPPPSVLVTRAGSATHYLVTRDSSFRIISFTVSSEIGDGDILEANCTGSSFSHHAFTAYYESIAGTEIYFYCIRAVHTNGKEYTLKPFSVKR